jgi:alkanesulfonate monooxygenase SsuD/methylene tetrahydromethanopterin reductase-like flavin-dependent oxidoreductase (luciferase family)
MTRGFGLTLPNRGVLLGAVKPDELLNLGEAADQSGAFRSLWVGDSILAKPRVESVVLLGALAGRTKRVRLGVACMATFVHRHPVLLALQWSSLDVLSNGRALLIACLGGADEMSAAQALEHRTMGIASKERIGRLEEGITLLRRLFTEERVTHHGRFFHTDGVTIEPRPVQKPLPIWIASNPTTVTYKVGQAVDTRNVERAFRRAARLADGWMTNKISPRIFAEQWGVIRGMAVEEGRDPDSLGNVLYHNININPDRTQALEESTRFLNAYYTANFTPSFVEAWTAMGTPAQCIEQFRAYFDAGVQEITVRLTSWDQRRQLELFCNEIAPAFARGDEKPGVT